MVVALLLTVLVGAPATVGTDAKYSSKQESAAFGLGSPSIGAAVGHIHSTSTGDAKSNYQERWFSTGVSGAPECSVNGASHGPGAFRWTPNGATFDTYLEGCGPIHLRWVATDPLAPKEHGGYTIGDNCSGEEFRLKSAGTTMHAPALVSGNIGVHEVPEGTEGSLTKGTSYWKVCGLP